MKVLVGAFNQGHDCEIFANLHFFALLGSPTLCILYCTCLGFRSKGFSIKDFLILFCFGKDLLWNWSGPRIYERAKFYAQKCWWSDDRQWRKNEWRRQNLRILWNTAPCQSTYRYLWVDLIDKTKVIEKLLTFGFLLDFDRISLQMSFVHSKSGQFEKNKHFIKSIGTILTLTMISTSWNIEVSIRWNIWYRF